MSRNLKTLNRFVEINKKYPIVQGEWRDAKGRSLNRNSGHTDRLKYWFSNGQSSSLSVDVQKAMVLLGITPRWKTCNKLYNLKG